MFRKWAAISAIAGAAQRRVWTVTAQSMVYPNMYNLLVGPPGTGKSQAISRVSQLWTSVNGLHVAPNSMTRAALVDAIDRASTKLVSNDGLISYHALTVPSSEFGVLVPAYDTDFLSHLTELYDCGDKFREERRHARKPIDIDYPSLNILGGTQPQYLAELLPDVAWGQGFTSRLLMIYSAKEIRANLFDAPEIDERLKRDLSKDLEAISNLYGAMVWSLEARHLLEPWASAGMPPVPTHSRLQNYNARRLLHMVKLCMIATLARTSRLVIEAEDVSRARDWLLEAESVMPDIFLEMSGKSDKQVIEDLNSYMWQVAARNRTPEGKAKPIHIGAVIHFLQGRVPAEKVMRIVDLCERSGVIQRVDAAGQLYMPSLKDQLPGVE